MSKIQPMLASHIENMETLRYPLLASPKLDGVRAIVHNGQLLSRRLKLIPNRYVQQLFSHSELNGLDGELIVGDETAKDVFRATTSGVMSFEGRPDVQFKVFDDFTDPQERFDYRYRSLLDRIGKAPHHPNVSAVYQHQVNNLQELIAFEEKVLGMGFEGVMARSLHGYYKFGRSTNNEGILLKLKRFVDSEAKILGVIEQNHNDNEPIKNALGLTKRSSHQENLRPAGVMGALEVEDCNPDSLLFGIQFRVGTGFDDKLRREFWEQRESIKGKIIKYRYLPTGVKEKPRHPSFLGFRDLRDM